MAFPVTLVVGASALATFIFRPVGPFDPEQRMYLLDNAINYLFAAFFQAILFGFLLATSYWIRKGRPATPPWPLVVSLAVLYPLIAACMVLLLEGFPHGQALLPLGLAIIIFSWLALISALRYSGRSFIEPRLDR